MGGNALKTLTADEIADRLALRPGTPLRLESRPEGQAAPLRAAAVLVPLLLDGAEWHLLFTRRTQTVQNHKGQVSFPGGSAEPEDLTPQQTALREAYEEIGLLPENAQILGVLPIFETNTAYRITPVVGILPWGLTYRPSPEEVSRIFTVPLLWLADPAHYEERLMTNRLGQPEQVVFYQPYDGEVIWGVTGRLVVELIHALS